MDVTYTAVDLIRAAARRTRVRLTNGQEGVLVFAPNPNRKPQRMPRHGDLDRCGVRLDGHHRDHITAFDADAIAYIEWTKERTTMTESKCWVIQLPEDRGEVFLRLWNNGATEAAWRAHEWDTWSPPLPVEERP